MQDPEAAAELKKKRTFRKFSYRGIDLDQYVAKHHPSTNPHLHPPKRPTTRDERWTGSAASSPPSPSPTIWNMDEKHRSLTKKEQVANTSARITDSLISPRTSSAMSSMPAPAEGSTVV